MLPGYPSPWEHYPKNLYFGEVHDPYVVLNKFFFTWPKDHKSLLKKWKEMVTGYDSDKGQLPDPGDLLFARDETVRLVEACYVLWINRRTSKLHKDKLLSPELIEKAREKWICFPKNLSSKELLNPYLALKKIYENISVQKYREHLKDWLYAAFDKNRLPDDRLLLNVEMVYHNLCRLYAAAWMIQQTEGLLTRVKSAYREGSYHAATEKETTESKAAEDIKKHLPVDPNAVSVKPFEPKMTLAEKQGIGTITGYLLKAMSSIRSITYLGSHPKPFTYYLLILVDDEEKLPENQIAGKLIIDTKALIGIYPIVYKLQRAIDGLNSKGRFWNMVFEKGINVYTANGLILPALRALSPQDHIAGINAGWNRWCTDGRELFQGAKHYLKQGNNKLALVLLQQAAAHTLTSILQILFGYRQSGHNLSKLLSLTLLFTDDLVMIFDLDTGQGKAVFDLLKKGYAKACYHEIAVTENPVKIAADKVGMLLAKAKAIYRWQLEQQDKDS